jgi:hypothetical protein
MFGNVFCRGDASQLRGGRASVRMDLELGTPRGDPERPGRPGADLNDPALLIGRDRSELLPDRLDALDSGRALDEPGEEDNPNDV